MTKRKIVKTLTVTLLSLLFIVLVACSIALNFVFTPEKITPTLNKMAQNYVKSDVSLGRVDLSLFSTFPYFTAEIDSLRVSNEQDSLADFIVTEKCIVSINPLALLGDKVDINRLLLRNSTISVIADSTHSSFDLFLVGEEAQDAADSLQNSPLENFAFDISGIELDSANVFIHKIDDNRVSAYKDITLTLDGNLTDKIADFDFYFDFKDFEVIKNDERVLGDVSLMIDSEMKFDRDSLILTFEDTRLVINKIALTSSGMLRADSLSTDLYMDIESKLTTPSLSEFLVLIPGDIVNGKDKLDTKGSVNLELKIKGEYTDSLMPDVQAKLLIENAYAKYESRKLALENVDCDANMFVSFNNPLKSYAKINKFHVSSSDILDLNLSGKVVELLGNPLLNLKVNTDIDFSRLTEIFPLQEGVELKGHNKSDIEADFRLFDVEKGHYGKMNLSGESVFTDLYISMDASKMEQDTLGLDLYVEMEKGKVLFGDYVKDASFDENLKKALVSSVDFSGFGYKDKDGNFAIVKKLSVLASTSFDMKTKEVKGIDAKLQMQNINTGIVNDIDVNMKSSNISLLLLPEDSTRNITIKAAIQSDSIDVYETINNSDLSLSHANFDVDLVKIRKGVWNTKGNLGFSNLKLFSYLFPLNIEIPNSNLALKDRVLTLNNTHLKVGNSFITATGEVRNLITSFFRNKTTKISGNLKVKSKFVDIEELILATNKSILFSEDSVENKLQLIDSTGNISVDSLQEEMILIPKNVNLTLNLDLDKLKYQGAIIDNIKGRAKINKGILTLKNLKLKAIGADAVASIVYKNVAKNKSNIFVDMKLKNADINRLGGVIPAVDSLMPMLKSFEGMVDFDFKAISDMKSDMTFDMSTLKSALSLDGQNLVLMDSETFGELAKMLKFKNRERNLIDSLNVLVTVKDSKVDVLPFEVTMDRYRAIIGGTQTVEMTEDFTVDFKYNISILKSPLPFKAGVDVFGNLDNYDYKITKAKLKKTDFDVQDIDFEKFRESIKEE